LSLVFCVGVGVGGGGGLIIVRQWGRWCVVGVVVNVMIVSGICGGGSMLVGSVGVWLAVGGHIDGKALYEQRLFLVMFGCDFVFTYRWIYNIIHPGFVFFVSFPSFLLVIVVCYDVLLLISPSSLSFTSITVDSICRCVCVCVCVCLNVIVVVCVVVCVSGSSRRSKWKDPILLSSDNLNIVFQNGHPMPQQLFTSVELNRPVIELI